MQEDLTELEVEQYRTRQVTDYEESSVRDSLPAHWMPATGVVPWGAAGVREWREGFHELVYRLYGALVAAPRIDSYREARLVLMIAEQVRSSFSVHRPAPPGRAPVLGQMSSASNGLFLIACRKVR